MKRVRYTLEQSITSLCCYFYCINDKRH